MERNRSILALVVLLALACTDARVPSPEERPEATSLASLTGEPVWPGTSTRYYPGIYPRYRDQDFDVTKAQAEFDAWFSGREDQYKEFLGTTPVTHLGLNFNVDPGHFFTAYWRSSATAPYDWKTQCGRITAAQDPNAAPGGQPLYDWAWWDSLLAQPFIAQGKGKLIIRVMETYASGARTPTWMKNEGYAKPGTSDSWTYCQMQDAATVYLWQDVMAAFAKRYRNDPRIAAMLFDEAYTGLWVHETLCGNLHGLPDAKAASAGLMEVMKAYLDEDPGMLWAIVNWFPAQTPIVETWERGYDLGGGQRTVGADDLPGVQGHLRQDIKFFNNEGAGAPCSIDATGGVNFNNFLAQHYAINRTAPIFVGSESNGWSVASLTGRRNGANNPWNVDPWPPWNPPGSLPNDDGDLFPSARFWVWYTSGAPRAATAAARDSGLGQPGVDPCGVIPSNFYSMDVPSYAPASRPAWTPSNLSLSAWLAAFDTFGPRGTMAMFNHPPGYLEQFASTPPPRPSLTIPRAPVPPTIDGDLSEFAGAPAITFQAGGAEVSYRLAWDDAALYLAATVSDPKVNATLTQEDGDLWNDDSIEVLFDTAGDRAGWNQDDYKLFVNALGTRHEMRGAYPGGVAWDPPSGGFTSAVQLGSGSTLNGDLDVDTGYFVEARLEFAAWGIAPPRDGTSWGLQLALNDLAGVARTQGAWSQLGAVNDVAAFGTLLFAGASSEQDAGTQVDAGSQDAGWQDAGASTDAGVPGEDGGQDAPEPDAGARSGTVTSGCGCGAAPPAALGSGLLAALLAMRKRRHGLALR